jgi:hypothetical protein
MSDRFVPKFWAAAARGEGSAVGKGGDDGVLVDAMPDGPANASANARNEAQKRVNTATREIDSINTTIRERFGWAVARDLAAIAARETAVAPWYESKLKTETELSEATAALTGIDAHYTQMHEQWTEAGNLFRQCRTWAVKQNLVKRAD